MTSVQGFAAAAVLLLLAASLLATRPWWLRGSGRVRRRRANIAAYRTRLAELDAEISSGLLPAAEADALKAELAARVLAETGGLEKDDAAESVSAPPARRRSGAIVLAGLLLAAFAAGGYWLDGSWRLQRQIASRAVPDATVVAMVETLADKLRQHPQDAEGWALLGRSYFALQRFGEAADAYAQANAHAAAPTPEWTTDQGEALAFADENNLQDRSEKLFEQALQLDPDFGKALWYAGLAAAQRGDGERARELWTRLSRQELSEQMRGVVLERLAALDGKAMEGAAEGAGTGPAAAEDGAGTPVTLHLHVSLKPELAAKVPPDATLLVFAQADGGPPMPLAVRKIPGAKLPAQVTLDDGQSMIPAMKLSKFDRYVVTARLSRSGLAQAESGDLQGSLKLGRGDAASPLQLQIDSVVP